MLTLLDVLTLLDLPTTFFVGGQGTLLPLLFWTALLSMLLKVSVVVVTLLVFLALSLLGCPAVLLCANVGVVTLLVALTLLGYVTVLSFSKVTLFLGNPVVLIMVLALSLVAARRPTRLRRTRTRWSRSLRALSLRVRATSRRSPSWRSGWGSCQWNRNALSSTGIRRLASELGTRLCALLLEFLGYGQAASGLSCRTSLGILSILALL